MPRAVRLMRPSVGQRAITCLREVRGFSPVVLWALMARDFQIGRPLEEVQNHVNNLHFDFLYYNWVRIHETIRCTPAMEAGLTGELHDMEWLAGVIEDYG